MCSVFSIAMVNVIRLSFITVSVVRLSVVGDERRVATTAYVQL